MKDKYIRLWFRTNGSWFYEQYPTSDPLWREAFALMGSSGAKVRIEYIDSNKPPCLDKTFSSYSTTQTVAR
jgi:hypothetical protein